MSHVVKPLWIAAFNVSLCLCLRAAPPADIVQAIATIRAVGAEGRGNAEASVAWKTLAACDVSHLTTLLAAMDGTDELIANWFRAAVDTVVSREQARGGKLPVDGLVRFLAERGHNPRARRLAFELLARVEPASAEKMLAGMLDDPSLELRRDAVQRVLNAAATAMAAGKKPEAVAHYQKALRAARDVDQIQEVAKRLRELGETVDLPKLFGFLTHWKVIGPFDNTEGKGFATVFPPEKQIDLAAEYEGKQGKVRWTDHQTAHELGMVNINSICGQLKGVLAYAYTEFNADTARPAELRLGTKNAWKVWLNGQRLFEREEYHRGMQMDQYRLPARLRPGRNTILVKICQNELVEKWTVEWEFQLRVCDLLGAAIPPAAP